MNMHPITINHLEFQSYDATISISNLNINLQRTVNMNSKQLDSIWTSISEYNKSSSTRKFRRLVNVLRTCWVEIHGVEILSQKWQLRNIMNRLLVAAYDWTTKIKKSFVFFRVVVGILKKLYKVWKEQFSAHLMAANISTTPRTTYHMLQPIYIYHNYVSTK